MRVSAFEIRNDGPLGHISSNVVVFAGPNGVGKTRIQAALLTLARDSNPNPYPWMAVQATSEDERELWGRNTLDTRQAQEANLLQTYLRRNQRRNQYRGSFLNFDSDRAIRNVQSYTFSWDIGDPFGEDIDWDIGFQSLYNRYNDVRHSLFRLVERQRREIAEQVLALQKSGANSMPLNFPDVLEPFKNAFWRLLAPKEMLEASVKDQQIYYTYRGQRLNFETLSSGEREVVNIVFDFILRGPQDCVVLFDEPELHLHPELSYKLLTTLSSIGKSNQFIFSTHSPEIISASLENTVIFVTPSDGSDKNQAIIVHRDDKTHHALQALGQSIGVISLGKKLVLIEGEETSLDKQTYGAILQNQFPEFVLVPAGGKDTIRSFDDIRDNILDKTIWGVDFFLLCDGDATNALGKAALAKQRSYRIKLLPRYHLENYFLDEHVLAQTFETMEPPDHWLRNPDHISAKLREIAGSVVAYAAALSASAAIREIVGNVSLMPKGAAAAATGDELAKAFLARAADEGRRVTTGLEPRRVEDLVKSEFDRLHRAVQQGGSDWIIELPGRVILNKFAAAAGIQVGRLKQLYLLSADKPKSFADIYSIFNGFRDGE